MRPFNLYRRGRLAAGLLLLASAACAAPAPSTAQTPAERVARAPDGEVRLSYPSREGVCGIDESIGFRRPGAGERGFSFFGNWRSTSSRADWERECVPGPLFVTLRVRAGRVEEVRTRVGQAPAAGAGAVTDLGRLDPAEAARYLLSLVRDAPADASRDALLAAVLADAPDAPAELLRLARDASVPRRSREQAAFWVAAVGDRAAVRQLHRLADDASVDGEVRESAIFAIGQTGEAEDAAFLRALYPRLQGESLKEKAIFSLSQMKGQGSERWLLDLAADRGEPASLREKAIFWAGQGGASLDELDALYERLDDTKLREQIIFSFSQRREPEAAARLLRLARGAAEGELRKKAIFWLGQAAGREVTRELAGIAQLPGAERSVQEQAVFALSQRPREEGVPALVQIARTHRDAEIRKKALFWLGQTGDPRALELFEEILR